jgi:hypothetical protein
MHDVELIMARKGYAFAERDHIQRMLQYDDCKARVERYRDTLVMYIS